MCSRIRRGVVSEPILLPFDGFQHIVRHFDGQSSLIDIQARVLRQTGLFLALNELEDLVRRLDAAMILEGPTFAAFHQAYRESGRRPAALAGRSYAATVRSLRAQLEQFFVDSNGAGLPAPDGAAATPSFRGILSPHIDFHRGGSVYTWSYKELVENSQADTFVVLGVAHQYCRRRFALTSQGFRDAAGPGADGSSLRRSDCLAGGPRSFRRRAVASDRALDRVSGRLPAIPAGRTSRLFDRADSGRVVSRLDGARDRSDR